MKFPLKKPRLLQTETIGSSSPGLSVMVKLIIETEEGNHPHRKLPMVPNTKQNARPHSLKRWTLTTHTNKMFA